MGARRTDQGWVTFAWVVAGLGMAAVLTIIPLALYGLTAGDPYGRTFVEHRANGFYLGRRACDSTPIRTVAVSVYDETAAAPAPPVWTASATRAGTTRLRLLAPDRAYETHATSPDLGPRAYAIVTDADTDGHDELVVDLAKIRVGQLDFGEGRAVSPADYDRMDDGDFGCT